MMVHLFGAVSFTSCAAYALKRSMGGQNNKSDLPATVIVKHNFYVDDRLRSSAM